MTRDGVSATVLDSGGEFLGQGLCSSFQSGGWSEDVSAESSINASRQAAADASAASASTAAKVAADGQSAADALSALQQDTGSLSNDADALGGDVSATNSDLHAEQSDAAQGPGDECVNASTTVYNDAATTIYNDEQTTLANDLQSAGRDIASTRSDVGALQAADEALSAEGLTAPNGASAAINAARKAVTQLISDGSTDIDAVAADVSQAYRIADGMATGACADSTVPGSPPAPPQRLS
jgi:hypothetical protein